jgi:hypothetical protein
MELSAVENLRARGKRQVSGRPRENGGHDPPRFPSGLLDRYE